MRRLTVLILIYLLTNAAYAQTGTITGKVIRMDTKTPLARVSVFLSNATFGTATTEDGSFTLTGIKPGQYELVVTSLGFEDFSQSVLVGSAAIKLNVEMMPRVTELQDVVITTNANWKANYQLFIKEFLGTSANARQCKIINPHAVNLIYSKKKKTLDAFSYDFIEIENHALGYRLKFLLKSFKVNYVSNVTSWQGRMLYEDLPASSSQKKKWERKRQEAYYGSILHFYRALISGRFTEDGFVMRQLQRKPNKKRATDELIEKKLAQYNTDRFSNRDSLNYWLGQANLSRYDDNLIRQPLLPQQVVRRTDQSGLFAITFPDYLYVSYTKKREEIYFKDIPRPLDMENFETSVITLYQPYALFDLNGAVVSTQSTMYEGTWSKSKVAELLPVDYHP